MTNGAGSVGQLRAQRRALQEEEDTVSFVRRLTQGRLDLVLDEERRRARGGDEPVGSVTDRLAAVFGQQQGGGSARPPRETIVPTDHPLMQQLDELCEEFQFAHLDTMADGDLRQLRDALQLFEQSCSQERHALFEQIDALTSQLVTQIKAQGVEGVIEG
jgi:hypothetical protein